MAKNKALVEERNGYRIELVEEEIELAGQGNKTTTIRTLQVTSRTNRIVKDRLVSLEEAREVADAQPAVED